MGIEIISGFDLKDHAPLDDRAKVADEAGRLAIKWVSKGLLCFQEDTEETYQYKGTPPSNIVGDWVLFTAEGAQGPSGNDGADGVDGDKYAGVSTDSITIPQNHPTSISMTITLGLAWTPGQPILVAYDVDNSFTGSVVSYSKGTGAIVINSDSNLGSGLWASWTINLAGGSGIQGKAFAHIESDVNPFDNAKVAAIEAGIWTPQAPWSASILNDTRSPITQPAALNGSMNDHSVVYDGASWFDNGIWRGPQGAKGATGNTGSTGATGSKGDPGVANGVTAMWGGIISDGLLHDGWGSRIYTEEFFSPNIFLVKHNIGNNNYSIAVSPYNTSLVHAVISAKGINDFQVKVYKADGSEIVPAFMKISFQVFEY